MLGDSEHPLVSVLTPSFNQALWIETNIASVQSQSYSNIEHVIMDGGSTDHTVEVLQTQAARVSWRSEPDRGQSHAINKAFAESEGEIIGWLNSDDAYWSPRVVEEVVGEFRRRPDVDVLYGHCALVNAEGLVLQVLWVPPFNRRLLRAVNFLYQPSVFLRRSALGDALVREEYDYCMDRELWLRLESEGRRFERMDRILAIDRHHSMRKSMARLDLAMSDRVRLSHDYGIRDGALDRVAVKAKNVVGRALGMRFAVEASGPPGEWIRSDGLAKLTRRQLSMKRRNMPGVAETA